MHEYSKRIGEHIKSCYSDFNKMNREELDELKAWACVMKDLTEYDINKRGIEAMDEAEQEEKMYGRMGYRGRAANGRFVHRSGRGRSAGYTPYLHMMDDGMDEYDMYDDMPYPMTGYRMGYTGGNMGNSSSSGSYSGNYGGGNSRSGYEGMRQPSRYGESYDRYKDSRRHYTENPTPEHQQKMKDDADDVFDDIEELAKKIYSDADANDKAKFKQKMTQLVQNMK